MEFKPGDVVQLKSGGPKMSIRKLETIDQQPAAVCDWFDGSKQVWGTFRLAQLTKA